MKSFIICILNGLKNRGILIKICDFTDNSNKSTLIKNHSIHFIPD